jgi:CRISPR-associated endonuclease/helicase Cas3
VEPLAHSARPDQGISAQLYADHIRRVFGGAVARADLAACNAPLYGEILRVAVGLAALFHDLGKLDPANQRVLAGPSGGHLPLNHVDAGVAHLLAPAGETDLARQLAAAVVYAHHRGLPSLPVEAQKGEDCFRDCTKQADGRSLCQITDERLPHYLTTHTATLPELRLEEHYTPPLHLLPLLTRLALSCLVDADHGDTARHYGNVAPSCGPPLRPAERLQALDAYVRGLAQGQTDEKTRLRNQIYAACRGGDTSPSLVECDSPVGSGKTTAVMAHLLQAARAKGLRRLFIVLPFTNIIDQSVNTYRNCLVLPGERPEEVVAAHHHRAEYAEVASRHLSALWQAPVVVTTAVQFFETLAGRHPSAIRKLHQLANSGIFIDESHACLPAALWPQAWDWLAQMSRDWNCHLVFGSGSLNRVWQLEEFVKEPVTLPQLVGLEVRSHAAQAEKTRITYRARPGVLELEQLADWLPELPGPRLVIVNTVQTAAALARLLANRFGPHEVEHLSTALTPGDRNGNLKRVKDRLGRGGKDPDWTLVATSCVEAGVDVSFRTGLRERASLTSLIQVGGRVNRSNEHGTAEVWDFQLRPVGLVRENRGFRDSARVLTQLLAENRVAPEFCTEALRREIRLSGRADLDRELRQAEEALDFPEVERLFRVIDQATMTVVIDPGIQDQLEAGKAGVDWQRLQQASVQIYANRALEFGVRDFPRYPGLKGWTLAYDSFLGYMAGALSLADAQQAAFIA